MGPRACYDEGKRFSETLCYLFAKEHQLPVTIVRPFNNYGPGMKLDDGRLPADMARAVSRNEDLVLHSDGTPTRTFCYIADAIVCYLKVLTHTEFDYFNIGQDGPEISVRAFAELFQKNAARLLDYKGTISFQPSQEKEFLTHNPERRCPDINKARTVLGFAPTISPDEGISRFLEFLEQERQAR